MKRVFEYSFIVPILFAFSLSIFGQGNEKIERELLVHIKNIEQWSSYTNRGGEDLSGKLDEENKIFEQKLLKYAKLPSTLKYKFGELSKFLSISTSEDGKFRIYSWDTQSGGTMHFYKNVYQYQSENGKVFSKSENLPETDPSGFVSDIFHIKTKSGKVYLARFSSVLGNSLSYQMVQLFNIEGKSLNDKIKLIKTKSGLQNSIGFEYNFFSVVDRKERPIKLILYDKAAKSIKIPVVIQKTPNDYGTVTNKFIVYKFNGKYFVKTK